MGFIKLTMAQKTGLDGGIMYIDVAHIEAMRADEEGSTIFVIGDDSSKYFVKESPESILKLIELEKRGMSVL